MNTTYSARPIPFNGLRLALVVAAGLVLGIAAVHIAPLVAVGILAGVFLLILMLRRPEFAILGYLIFTSTFFNSSVNPGISIPGGHVYVTDLLLGGMLLMIPLRALVEPGFRIVHTPLDLPLLAFVAMAYLSTAIAIIYRGLTIQVSLGEMRVIASYLLFFAVTNLVRSRRQLRMLLGAIAVLACMVSAAMLIQYIRGPADPILAGRVEVLYTEGRGYADIFRIIPPGDSIVLVTFIVIGVALWLEEAETPTLPALLVAAVTGLGVLLTFKRHYWAAVVIDAVLLMYLYRRKTYQHILMSVLVGLVLVATALFYTMNFTGASGPRLVSATVGRLVSLTDAQTYTSPTSSLRWRDFESAYALPQIAAHPVFGLGLGAHYRPLVPPKDWASFDGRGYMHNAQLWILTKAGLLAYLPFLTFLLLGLFRGFRRWSSVPDSRLRAIALGISLAYLAMLIGSWVEPTLMEGTWTPVVGVMLAVNEVIFRGAANTRPNMAATSPGLATARDA